MNAFRVLALCLAFAVVPGCRRPDPLSSDGLDAATTDTADLSYAEFPNDALFSRSDLAICVESRCACEDDPACQVIGFDPAWRMPFPLPGEQPDAGVEGDSVVRDPGGGVALASSAMEGRIRFVLGAGCWPSGWPIFYRAVWSAFTPNGTSVGVRARFGNSATPDASWSAWTEEAPASPLELQHPDCGFDPHIQLEVHFRAEADAQRPRLDVLYVGVHCSQIPC